ncbi:GrpB family protein [Streptomyces alkaliphilus]|uniref:GrpB family protein n=1 Tax=Streptomyces alkaliphilus TaxID=1472722 RepID=UPI00117C1964|nr:GrpB family protein [Streptomyces alkaliphilus]MQS07929.1 GrpB family protein [Streptomyces alkaliphilus]
MPDLPQMSLLVVDPSPEWARVGAELVEEVRRLLGPEASRVAHIGSTSIPGMAAKPVFDLQVGTELPLDAAEEKFSAPLTGLGFTLSPHRRDHVPAGRDDSPERWAKRLWWRRGHPDGDANLHLRREGSPNLRLALLFRDWFRAHPEAVPGYATFKRVLARHVVRDADDTAGLGAYSDIKDPVVDVLVEIAEGWAARTGWQLPQS